jgi:hypothetical protein
VRSLAILASSGYHTHRKIAKVLQTCTFAPIHMTTYHFGDLAAVASGQLSTMLAAKSLAAPR